MRLGKVMVSLVTGKIAVFLLITAGMAASAQTDLTYPPILADQPVAYWTLQGTSSQALRNLGLGVDSGSLDARAVGEVASGRKAQPSRLYPDFSPGATAVAFAPGQGHISVPDPGEGSPLDFTVGDAITLEAWVSVRTISSGQNMYLIGKGRTGRSGEQANNQNYALRLRGQNGTACPSFLFRNARNRPGNHEASEKDWHRWTSEDGFLPGSGWHHVAITYTFGQGDSLRGYLDGREIEGRWDMGGATDDGPVVDDDELWLGSSMGGNAGSSLDGLMNEVAIHRRALRGRELRERFHYEPKGPLISASELPPDAVRVELFENVEGLPSWSFETGEPVESFNEPAVAFASLPWKYNPSGVRADRSNPYLLRASMVKTLPPGEHRLLLRSLQSARLSVDGSIIVVTPAIKPGGDGHSRVPPSPETLPPGLRFIRAGHHDAFVTVTSDGSPAVFVLEAIIGGKGLRPDIGELSVSLADAQGRYRLLAPGRETWPHTDEGWRTFIDEQRYRMAERNTLGRQTKATAEHGYWEERHHRARQALSQELTPSLPVVSNPAWARHPIDRFVGARLEQAGVPAAALLGDEAFLRRLSLDTRGVIPSSEEILEFLADASPDRRDKAVDRFLDDPRWADHWVSYWQDVLAENPGILKPTLNNTGPFRYWIHESFLDNKPMDRFATELIRMEGSVYYGGPAGFRLATQNDAPMADRAQIIAQGFLAMNLTCARCHDAPYHEFKQKDLFSVAAMLKNEPQEVPTSSSIPPQANIKLGRLVNVTLHPGEKVDPVWPFPSIMHDELLAATDRRLGSERERLAALVTDPRNDRFPKVMVNRLWKRYLGWGLVEPVDDWENARPSHPILLSWLAREFVWHGYDWKHLARLILTSETYQREAGWHTPDSEDPEDRLFASPARRRMTAEQLVDSLFAAAGKDMRCELLTLDNDSRRPPNSFLSFGYPQRAWQFTSLSNDRDRPALSLPRTQEIVDVLAMFGWRESRQNARTERNHEPNVLQPAALANGRLGNGRIARLTDQSELTSLCLSAESLDELLREIGRRVLSRPPRGESLEAITAYLEPGFQDRIVEDPPAAQPRTYDRSLLLSWSNHLNAEATEIMMAKESRESLGDPPTARLRPEWRERMEDVVWAMFNSPEFVFVP